MIFSHLSNHNRTLGMLCTTMNKATLKQHCFRTSGIACLKLAWVMHYELARDSFTAQGRVFLPGLHQVGK